VDQNTFWDIIATARRQGRGDQGRQEASLRRQLQALSAREVLSFQRHYQRCLDRSYHWDLWGAAYIICGGCSDDGFEYFRSWLISRGRDVFEAALKDPQSLGRIARPDETACEYEPFGYVARQVYQEKTGSDLPGNRFLGGEPRGEPWEEDDLEQRFPKLWRQYGYAET